MDPVTAQHLIDLNTRFYAEHASSFSATRGAPWEGWTHVADALHEHLGTSPAGLDVLDLACGNLRFERFLAQRFPDTAVRVAAIDNCPALAADTSELAHVDYRSIDVLSGLLAIERGKRDDHAATPGEDAPAATFSQAAQAVPPAAALPQTACDLAVSFGFMHHVPGAPLRRKVLELLVDSVRPGGMVAVSFWQFMDDERLARKAARSLELALAQPPFAGFTAGSLEEGDHFLGWQTDDAAFRYCHHFTDAEIDRLAASVSATASPIASFSADGSSHRLNRYIILKRAF